MLAASIVAIALAVQPVDVRRDGALGFPQNLAEVLCDTADVRLSVFNDAEFLYVQAVIWKDADDTPGETDDGRVIGDWSTLLLDLDADAKDTAEVDRDYSLNPWPSIPGLHYSVSHGGGAWSGLQGDSKGRGSINFVESPEGAKTRVECFLIPLEEIRITPGQSIRLAYWGWSPNPALTVNSVGLERDKAYYSFHLPRSSYHEVKIAERPAAIDANLIPEGRDSISLNRAAPKPMPEVGARPPEVAAEAWLNHEGGPPTLASLEGKVVVVEFWATWCAPCVAGIPHLNELHAKHAKDGLVILSFTDQAAHYIEKFKATTPMHYILGAGSTAAEDFGVTGIPYAFVIGRDGLIRWRGHPAASEFDQEIEKALAEGVGVR